MSPVHHDHSADTAVAVMKTVRDTVPVSSDGTPVGFSANRTLRVRVELSRQLRRRRTQLALGFMALLPVILVIAFAFGTGSGGRGAVNLVDLATSGSINFALVSLFFSASFLLIVVISLFFGDTIASEASWSSLRYLLAMPVPRVRLIRQKVLVAGLLSLFALLVLPISALTVGGFAYGWNPLSTPVGEQFSFAEGLLRIGLIVSYVAIQLTWVAGLALMLSVLTDAPLGAVGGAVLLYIVSSILDQITALGELRNFLPTHFAQAYLGLLTTPMQFDDIIKGTISAVCYFTAFCALAFYRFSRKDVVS
jgi:ABC-2 type transport system permease protein